MLIDFNSVPQALLTEYLTPEKERASVKSHRGDFITPKKSKVTRSSASLKQRQVIDSLASATSPPKVRKTKKSRKQASLESPEVKGITPQVVTVTKQVKSSEDEKSSSDGNSTGDESALLVT